jgi:hypothetical protein
VCKEANWPGALLPISAELCAKPKGTKVKRQGGDSEHANEHVNEHVNGQFNDLPHITNYQLPNGLIKVRHIKARVSTATLAKVYWPILESIESICNYLCLHVSGSPSADATHKGMIQQVA